MAGLAPKLPLRKDESDGYQLIKDYREMVTQNMIMLVLTNPGERMMDPNFGVGLRRYLFEQDKPGLFSVIESKIRSQVMKYLPYINVLAVEFRKENLPVGIIDERSIINVNIVYMITPLQARGELEVNVETDLSTIPL